MKQIKDEIVDAIVAFTGDTITRDKLYAMLQNAPRKEFGDFALPCFQFQKEFYDKNPNDTAHFLQDKIKLPDFIRTEIEKGFLNFFIDSNYLTQGTLEKVIEQQDRYGKIDLGQGKMVVFDYSAPNIGKPLHVGHIRSTILGDSLIKILNFSGYKTHGINYIGDIGLHLAKTIAAYNLWGDRERLEQNPEQEILNLYIRFNKELETDKALDESAKETGKLLEQGDRKTTATLDFITEMSLKAFDRVYQLLDIEFDETAGQSNFSDIGKRVVAELLEKGIAFKEKDGGIIARLEHYGLPNKVILKSDGTPIYMTQDLGAATYRKETLKADILLYIVASEQELYFKQLFKTLELNGNDWANDCFHVSFGMINLAEGKMSTREGTIVYLEEVLNKATDMARTIIEKKNPSLENKEEVAKMVGVGAIKHMVLGVDYPRNIEFSWERALNLEGNSAPYIQYSYARANSILEKIGKSPATFSPDHLTDESEQDLVKRIAMFPLIVESAAQRYRPHIIANYSYELSAAFNVFYNNVRVMDAGEQKDSKLTLVQAYMTTVKNAMGLLGIGMPNRM